LAETVSLNRPQEKLGHRRPRRRRQLGRQAGPGVQMRGIIKVDVIYILKRYFMVEAFISLFQHTNIAYQVKNTQQHSCFS
jgi:hypothetical protein